jgi:hypothetical protein
MCAKKYKYVCLIAICLISVARLNAQTDVDAIMMNKYQFCNGLMYSHSSWNNYWEGTLKRSNENLGTVSTQAVMYMGAYGITDQLNVILGAPYIWTKASAGTFHGMKGIQDASAFIKWKPVSKAFGNNKISLFILGGVSTPLSNYVIDYLPFSIGLGSTNVTARGMVDYWHKRWTVTGSASYIRHSNVKLDRDAYYDTELHATNEVKMPDAAFYQLRAGYRGTYLIAEGVLSNMTTLGGFDITRNNMPFPSNRMNATTVGVNIKYTLKNWTNLSLLAGANTTLSGRNMRQSKDYSAGVFYAFYFKNRKPVQTNNKD